MIQCFVVLIWITLDNPEVEDVYCIRRHVKVCKWNALHMSLAEVYNVILAIVATLYAFLVRNVDSNFSESKWISYAMYSVCVSWMIDGVLLVFSVSETVSSQLSTLSQIPPEVSIKQVFTVRRPLSHVTLWNILDMFNWLLRLPCSPCGGQIFRKKKKLNITYEGSPHNVF